MNHPVWPGIWLCSSLRSWLRTTQLANQPQVLWKCSSPLAKSIGAQQTDILERLLCQR
jgi:hypothetical protein